MNSWLSPILTAPLYRSLEAKRRRWNADNYRRNRRRILERKRRQRRGKP